MKNKKKWGRKKNLIVIGIDLDNTIVSYDESMYNIALKLGLIDSQCPKNKTSIREKIRQMPNGENEWQKLQALVYGKEMKKAILVDGVADFFLLCKKHNIPVFIISHKTEYSNYKPNSKEETKLIGIEVNLRKAALDWLEEKCFFERFGISKGQVFFCSSREEKIARIKELSCTHFIDDLEEVFNDPSFPKDVVKMLLSSNNDSPDKDVLVFSSWNGITDYLFMEENIKDACEGLLGEQVRGVKRISGGRNSRVFKISTNKDTYLVKQYFSHPKEQRNRLKVEYEALEFLHKNKINSVPKPISKDEKKNIAIYEYVKGKKVEKVTAKDMAFIFEFISDLKKLAAKTRNRDLLLAADACLSFQTIVNIIERRLKNLELRVKNNSSEIFKQLNYFLEKSFKPAYSKVLDWAIKEAEKVSIGFAEELKPKFRTLSPSDFGFHNSIRKPNGEIVFVDFEYFGTDSPMKLICDFMLHDAMKLSDKQKKEFFSKAITLFKEDKKLKDRVRIAYPLFGLVWCLILLNEFLSTDLQRREFAMINNNRYKSKHVIKLYERIKEARTKKQKLQLKKAKAMLKRIMSEYQNGCFSN